MAIFYYIYNINIEFLFELLGSMFFNCNTATRNRVKKIEKIGSLVNTCVSLADYYKEKKPKQHFLKV